MKTNQYGIAPEVLGCFDLQPSEYCYIQYLPIKLIGDKEVYGFLIPENLRWSSSLVRKAFDDFGDCSRHYIYLTVKHFYVADGGGNRPGWHSDGFLTEDINYIWYDKNPTQFCVQDFDIDLSHESSLVQFCEQVEDKNIIEYPLKTLIKMNQYSVHRVNPSPVNSVRTFVKLSFSLDKYNLKGNAHNYLLDYDWIMYDRDTSRNHPTKVINNE